MDTKILRQKILDLAIRGKLVEQDPNDEPASVLLERIKAEKERSPSDNKKRNRKKEITTDKSPYENEPLFEVPDNWQFVTLSSIFQHNTGKALNSANREGELLDYITTSNLYWGHFDLTNIKKMFFKASELEKYTVRKGDLLVCEGGDVGRSAIWNYDYSICIQNHIHRLRPKYTLNITFFFYVFMYYKNKNLIGGKGIGLQGLSSRELAKILLPLPPLAEQQRIVKEVEKWFAVIEQLEKDKIDLAQAIKQAKNKILDLAIRGKLLAQDPNDEPAEKLLKRINPNWTPMDNSHYPKMPFELPKGWVWCTLPEICSIPITDGTHQTPTYTDKENGIPFISSKDVTTQKIKWENIKYITKELHEKLYRRIAPQKNDILLAKNGTTGVAALVEDNRVFDIYVTLAVIRPVSSIFPQFLLWVINSPFCKSQFDSYLTGIGLPNLHLTDIRKTIIPLPPLAEQQRIVEKIEILFTELDNIQHHLK